MLMDGREREREREKLASNVGRNMYDEEGYQIYLTYLSLGSHFNFGGKPLHRLRVQNVDIVEAPAHAATAKDHNVLVLEHCR